METTNKKTGTLDIAGFELIQDPSFVVDPFEPAYLSLTAEEINQRVVAGLEELAARQAGDDHGDAELVRPGDRQGVDRLVAAVAHVGVAVEAVAEDLVHDVAGHELVVDPEFGDRPPTVLLGPLRDESVVERDGEDAGPELDESVERVGRVLAAREEQHGPLELSGHLAHDEDRLGLELPHLIVERRSGVEDVHPYQLSETTIHRVPGDGRGL